MLTTRQQIFEQIEKSKRILITFAKNWDGDAVASALALYHVLKKMGKEPEVVAERYDAVGAVYRFLPGFADIRHELDNLRSFIVSLDISNAKVGQIKYKIEDNLLNFIIAPKEGFFTADDVKTRSGEFKYDLVIVVDSPDLESLGRTYDSDTEFFYRVPIINIDHHSQNEGYGQINQVELTAIATAEIIFDLLAEHSRDLIDEDVATCLLSGIIAKTRSFKTANVTPQALSISSQLIAMGARREEIVNQLFRSRSLSVLKLWGRVLARLTSAMGDKLVWSVLTASDFEKTGTAEADLPDVIDELIVNIPQAHLILVVYEANASAGKVTRAIAFATRTVNALDLMKPWQPTGTKKLARIEIPRPLQEAETEITQQLQADLAKLSL